MDGFGAAFGWIFSNDDLRNRRAAESFSAVSVITGGEVLLKLPADPEHEHRRFAAQRLSPDPRPLGFTG